MTHKIERHPQRKAIEQAIVEGEPLRNVAKRAGVHASTVCRHKDRLSAKLARQHRAAEDAEAGDLLAKIVELEVEAKRIKLKAEEQGDLKTALSGVRELTRIVELLARIRGQIAEQAAVHIHLSPEWVALRAAITLALDPFPEARQAVAQALTAEGVGA